MMSKPRGRREEKGESERNKKRQEGGRERASEGVLPSNMLALMAQTALTFNRCGGETCEKFRSHYFQANYKKL